MNKDEKGNSVENPILSAEKYWFNKFNQGISKTIIGQDSKSNIDNKFEKLVFQINNKVVEKVNMYSNGVEPTKHVIFLAVSVLFINKIIKNDTVTVLIPVNSRDDGNGRRSNNTVLPIKIEIGSNITFKELLIQIRTLVVEAINHQSFSFEKLMYNYDINKSIKGSPFSDVGVMLESIHEEKHFEDHKLSLLFNFYEKDNEYFACIKYNTCNISKAAIENYKEYYIDILEKSILNLDVNITELEILSLERKLEIFNEINSTKRQLTESSVIHIFDNQLKCNPDAIAVIYKDHSISYLELNSRANRLANYLLTQGVTNNVIVGLMMDSSIAMVINMLGILKTGGTYLPLGIETPEYMLINILRDTNLKYLIIDDKIFDRVQYTNLLNQIGKEGIQRSQERAPLDFNSLPIPDRSLINYDNYCGIGQAFVTNCISLQATRGCPYKCIYCSKILRSKFTFRSAENVFEEIMHYYKLGFRRFSFMEDVFNLNIENGLRLFDKIIKSNIDIQLLFGGGLRADILTKEYVDMMVGAGTINIALALETASPRLQKVIGKNLNIEHLKEITQYISEKHVNVITELFLMLGFPGETEEESYQTLDFLKQIKWIHFPYLNIVKIYPNTDLEKLAIENKIPSEAISLSQNLGWHDLPYTLPYDKKVAIEIQSKFLNEYFFLKERLKQVLPHQMAILTENELINKYKSYLSNDINDFESILSFGGLKLSDFEKVSFADIQKYRVFDADKHVKASFAKPQIPENDAIKILLIDLTLFFSKDKLKVYDLVEVPLGLVNVLTYCNKVLGNKVQGKILKSRIDFDSYNELRKIIDDFSPDIIGVRALNYYKDFFHRTVSLIRQWGNKSIIVAGGPYATSSVELVLSDKNIDMVVVSEGEQTFVELVQEIIKSGKKLPDKESLLEIKGLIVRKKESEGVLRKIFNSELLLEESLEYKDNNPDIDISSEDAAAIFYTSGTTGKPKGIVLNHMGYTNVLSWYGNKYSISPGKNVVQLTKPTFDPSLEQIIGTLMFGGKVIIPDKNELGYDNGFHYFIEKYQANILNTLPYVLRDLISGKKIKCLRTMISGGDILDNTLKEQLVELGYELHNHYGPTETSIEVLESLCTNKQGVSIGRPIWNTGIFIFDSNDKLVPKEVEGELFLSGAGLARGYLNNVEATSRSFVTKSVTGEKLYKTGDTVKLSSDNNIKYIGRNDEQIKINGLRIELEQIKNSLLKYNGIKDVVVCRKKIQDTALLCAYLIVGELVTSDELRSFLKQILPFNMIPHHFIILDEFPKQHSNKIDINSLPLPKEIDPILSPNQINSVERKLIKLWSEILNIEEGKISLERNFFELGGHSLNIIMLMSKITEVFRIKISLSELFSCPNVRRMAKLIETGLKEKVPEIKPVEKKEYYPLSSAQKRMFFHHKLDETGVGYNMPSIFKIEGEFDVSRYYESIKQLVKFHDSYRTSFRIINNETVQIVHDSITFPIDEIKIEGELNNKSFKNILKNFVKPFDLSVAPLFRLGVIRVSESKSYLIYDMHHIIGDGFSRNIMVSDFVSRYNGVYKKEDVLQYKDYSNWQFRLSKTESFNKQKQFWLEYFKQGIPKVNFPLDFARPVMQNYQGAFHPIIIDKSLTSKLRKLMLSTNTTLFMNLSAFLSILLSKYSGQNDIVIGSSIFGRTNPQLYRTIGMFVNKLAIKSNVNDNLSYLDFLKLVKENCLSAFENQDFPFDDLVDLLNVERKTNRHPIFDISLVVQNFDNGKREGASIEGISVVPFFTDDIDTRFDLSFMAMEDKMNEVVHVRIEYFKTLFKEDSIVKIANYFIYIIEQVTKNNSITINEINILGEESELKPKMPSVDFNL